MTQNDKFNAVMTFFSYVIIVQHSLQNDMKQINASLPYLKYLSIKR